MKGTRLNDPKNFFNRELSQLEFIRRVFAQAEDTHGALLERLKFLCISSEILDEFFEIRVSGLRQQDLYKVSKTGADGLKVEEVLSVISDRAHELIQNQYDLLNSEIIPKLSTRGIDFLSEGDWTERQKRWLRTYFNRELKPIITPLGLDPAHPFPEILNKALAFIVTLEGKDAFGRNADKAIVQAPRFLPRIIELPSSVAGPDQFVLLTSIIAAFASSLFPGMKVKESYQFRVTRNSDLFIEEEAGDLLEALEGELSTRSYGDAVRLEIASKCPEDLVIFMASQFDLTMQEVYLCEGPVNLMRLAAVYDLVEREELKFQSLVPVMPVIFEEEQTVFDQITEKDILLHYPFESFDFYLAFLKQAIEDPKVVSIRHTLYRTGSDSTVVDLLAKAAKRGKEVFVVIELRARFDEEANIEVASKLQEVGVQVVYGIVGYKTHAKMCTVVRKEGRTLRRYVHLATGNYHAGTSRLYTDYSYFTSDRDIGEDVHKLFQRIATMSKQAKLKKIEHAPFTLHLKILSLIEREASNAKKGKPAAIYAKMNALTEPEVIKALYRASIAGVKIELIVRGICCLRPGVKGLSDKIRVRSIVGRFLEHTRVFCFENGGAREVYLSSADWMDRNFFTRVEILFPVLDQDLKERVFAETIDNYLKDNSESWMLQKNGRYNKRQAKKNVYSAQAKLSGNKLVSGF